MKGLIFMSLFIDFFSVEFFDGETINDVYVLLGNSENYIYNVDGIGFDGIEFLFRTAKDFNYFFRMDYDVNMIMKKLNLKKQEYDRFFNNDFITYKGFKLRYFRNKILIIQKGKEQKVFYDIFNFFNSSFVEVLKILELDKKFKEEFEYIKEFKLKRDKFSNKILKKIIYYNKLECFLGLKIVETIYNLLPSDLKTLKLYGSSAITNIYMKKCEIDKKINSYRLIKDFDFKIFKEMFFGGRMEAFKVGKFYDVYKYDINSAYPFVISQLREVKEIYKNKNLNEIVDTDIYYIKMTIYDNDLIGLLPVRLKSGIVVFPSYVEGYYYGFEVKAVFLYQKKYKVKLEILKRFSVVLGDLLFENINELYKKRLDYKQKNDKRNLIYKILLNSIYGKFSQKVGKNIFNNYYYAGLITSCIRGKILIDFIDYAKDIIFIATDGVLLKNKNDKLVINSELGNYEEIKIKDAFVVMSGVYYLIDYNNKEYTGQRGFHIDYKKVIELINQFGKVKILDRVFITIPYALKNYKKYLDKSCKIITIEKTLDIKNQIKRKFLFIPDENYLMNSYNSYLLNSRDVKLLEKIKVNYIDIDFYLDFTV